MGRVLGLPHIGTALGHAVRFGGYLRKNHSEDEVHVALSSRDLERARRFFADSVRLHSMPAAFEVNNPTGAIHQERFEGQLQARRHLITELEPELLLGDPGIQAAILSNETQIPWEGLMHGVYLPVPRELLEGKRVPLAEKVWGVCQSAMDQMVSRSTEGQFSSWADLRATGKVSIPNSATNEPSPIGEHLGPMNPTIFKEADKPVKCLVTLCSSGENRIKDAEQLRVLARQFGEVYVVGVPQEARIAVEGVLYGEPVYSHASLVGPDTTVITHGGHGTLNQISHAGRVIITPWDLDQLANGLIAEQFRPNYELWTSPHWAERLASKTPFKRESGWIGLDFGQI